MAFPSKDELKKKEDFKLSLLKVLDNGRLSDKQICSIIRSSVRKSWMQSPIRLLKLEMARLPDMNNLTRTKWLCKCEKCKLMFKMTDVETDHKKGEHKLNDLSDIEHFARSILDVTLDDLQVYCKSCHEIKTYAERYNISFDDAIIEKKVIKWVKENNTTQQIKFLKGVGYVDSEISNAVKRKESYRKLF